MTSQPHADPTTSTDEFFRLEPASLTPATAHAMTEIIHEAGFPKGVFNLILGGGSMGGALVEHPDVAGVSFTGGQSTGAGVAKAARNGDIDAGATVVCVLTGNGLKDPTTAEAGLDVEVIEAEPSVVDVGRALGWAIG